MASHVDQIGRYKILGELGRGAMGVVYQAQDPAIGRKIAIKTIRLNELTEESERDRMRERLFREAQSAGILSHPGIVTIYDIAEENGMAFIFMELVNGPPLEKMLKAEQTPDKETLLSIFRQTAAALDYAHKKGIVHRDIKPANIMVHDDGTAKITDFGVAKIVSQQMTQAGTIMGTPSYMSPEQVQGAPVSGRSDQFSLAVIAYEILTGEKPFVADYLPTLLFKVVRETPEPPQRLNPTLASAVEVVLNRAMSKNPADRYESCAEFVAALATACNTNPNWIPLPRGAGRDTPTGGSEDRMRTTGGSTMIETIADMSASISEPEAQAAPATALPAPAPSLQQTIPVIERSERPESSSLSKGILIGAFAVMVAAGAAFYWTRQRSAEPPPQPPPLQSAAPAAPNPIPESPAPAAEQQKAPAATPPPSPVVATPAAPVEAPFQITTNPPGATATFDDKTDVRCTTPCSVSLPLGHHSIALSLDGHRPTQRLFNLPDAPGLIVNLEQLMGTLSVTSNPPGLTFAIDGQEQGRKTPASVNLSAGVHRVQVIKGNDKQEFTVEIRDGVLTQKNIEWQ